MSNVVVTQLRVDATQALTEADRYEAAMLKLARASEQAAEREERLQRAMNQTAGGLTLLPQATDRATQAMARLQATTDPVARITQAFERATNQAATAVRGGAASYDQASAALDKLRTKQQQQIAALQNVGKASQASADTLRMSYDAAYANAARYSEVEQQVAQHVSARTLTIEQGNTILAGAGARFKQMGDQASAANQNVRLTAGQVQNLGYQVNDLSTMMLMGASPFQIIASQGGQIVQALGDGPGGVKGSLAAIGTSIAGLATRIGPVGFALAGATAAAGALWWMSSGSEAKEAANSIDEYRGLVDRLKESYRGVEAAAAGVWERAAIPTETMALGQLQDAAAKAKAELQEARDLLSGSEAVSLQTGTIGSAVAVFELLNGEVREAKGELQDLYGQFARGEIDARRLADAAARIQIDPAASDRTRELAAEVRQLAEQFGTAAANAEAIQAAIDAMTSGKEGRLAGGFLGDLRAQFGDLGSALDRMAPETMDDLRKSLKDQKDALTETDEAANQYAESLHAMRAGWSNSAADLRLQVEMFGETAGAIASARFEHEALTEARRLAAENDKLFDENGAEAQRIREVANEIGVLTDQLKALADADAQAKRVAETIASLDFQNSLFGMSETDREIATTLRQLEVSYESMDGQRIAGSIQYRAEQDRVQEGLEKQRALLSNMVSTLWDSLFDTNSADSFFDRMAKGFEGIGKQLQQLAGQNLIKAVFGEGVGYTAGAPRPGERSIFPAGFPAGYGAANQNAPAAANQNFAAGGAINVRAVTALNDNLQRSSRSALDVARQFDGLNERADSAVLDSFMQASGNWRNLSAADTAWCAAFANAAITQAGGKGTNSNLASSFMGWGQGTNTPQVGDIVVLKPQARGASGHVGFVAGFGDGTVQVFGGNQSNAANTRSFGLDQVRGYRTGIGVTGAGVSGSVSPAQGLPYIDGGYTGYNQTGGIPTPTARPGSTWFGENGKISEFMKSPIGQMGMQAVGAFGTGYSSGSMGGGALSGGLQAFVASGFNPIAGIVGAISGGAGGLFGGREQRKKEHQARAQEWAAQAQEWQAYQQEVRTGTGPTSGLRASQEAMANRLTGFVQTGSAAWKNGTNNSSALFSQVGAELGEYFARTNAEFGRAYEAQIASLNAGQGLSGPFISARDEILEAGKTLATFVDDTRVVFGDGSVEAQRAAEASIAQLRALLTGGQELSDIAAAVEQMRGAAAGLHTQLEALGKSADEAGQIVRDDLTTAMDRLRSDFTRGIQDQINDLDGKGYLADFRNLIEGVQQTMQDAALLGGVDTSLVDTFFAKRAQNLVNQSQLTGEAFDELVRAFPPLAGVVKEFSQAVVTATEAEIRSAIEGYEERLFAAQNVGNEIALFERRAAQDRIEAAKFGPDAILAHEAALAAERANMVRSSIQSYADRLFAAQNGGNDLVAFERQAARERVEAAKFGTDAVAAIEKTHAAERANIVLAGARSDLERAWQEHQNAVNDRVRALRTESTELQRTVDRLKGFVDGIRDLQDSLRLDQNLSTLAGQDMVDEAKRQFEETYRLAMGGDEDAMGRLTASASDYLSVARDYFASSADYVDIFDEVNRQLDIARQTAGDQLSEAEKQMKALEDQITLAEKALALDQQKYDALLGIGQGIMSLGTAIAALSVAQAAAAAAGVNIGAGGGGAGAGDGGAGGASFGRAVNYLNNNPDVAAGIAAGQTFGLPAGSSIEAIAKAHWERHGQGEIGIPGRKAYALGGHVVGPGTGTSDSIAAWLSNGEHVTRAMSVNQETRPFLDHVNVTGRLPRIAMPSVQQPARSGNDNAALATEMKAIGTKLDLLTRVTSEGALRVSGAVETGTRAQQAAAANAKRKAMAA